MMRTVSVNLLLITLIGCNSSSSINESVNESIPSITSPSFTAIALKREINSVQPMTGIVLWENHGAWGSDEEQIVANAISLEYSYMKFSDVVNDNKGDYDWSVVEEKLNSISGRGHQAILRFYYVYVNDTDPNDGIVRATTVPQYIKDLQGYDNNIVGIPEGQVTHFPDWSNEELQRFTLEFHSQFANKYDDDPRLAFLQVGFGLWGEYHIYDGLQVQLGVNFPSKNYQMKFYDHMENSYDQLPWSFSIDAANSDYSPFDIEPSYLEKGFGLFDDSFMHEHHSDINETRWQFFNYTRRYENAPFGGEFSYFEFPYDQENVLNPLVGAYGTSYEDFASKFHITYMIGNDTLREQSAQRLKDASMASGYRFNVLFIETSDTELETRITVSNSGVAPIYYDAYIAANGIRATDSLRYLLPGESKVYKIATEVSAVKPDISIESDHILQSQEIEFSADVKL